MIIFWIFAVAMVVIALIFLLRPFFLEMQQDEIERSALNVNITKERLAELKSELALETITQSEYEETREELEQALLFDVEQERGLDNISKINVETYNRLTRYSLLLVVPVMSVVIYFYLGMPEIIEGGKQQTAAAGHNSGTGANGKSLATVEEMIEKLAAKLKESPDNAEGWYILARSYISMNRYKEAVDALEKTDKLLPNNPTIMLRYADALTMLNGGRISGKPFDLIKRAIAIKPDNTTGLWLIGMGYAEQGDHKKAISYWNLLLPLLKDNKSIDEVNNLIRTSKSKAGIAITDSTPSVSTTKKKAATSLKVMVNIDPSMLKNVSMDDIVFIFAKAVSGPPMPLAVVRKQVKDLPLQVVLDDSMAMIPSMMLSSFDKVKITARISKSGKPLLQKGDIHSKEEYISLPYKGLINLNVNTISK